MQLRAQRGAELAGALEIQPGEGILQFGDLQHAGHGGGGAENGVHGVGVKLPPELHQLVVSQRTLSAGDGAGADGVLGSGVIVAVAGDQHIHRVGQLLLLDVCADLTQHHAEQIQLLEADGLIGRHQHSAPLAQLHQMLLGLHRSLGDGRTLHHVLQLLVRVGGNGVDGAVVHGVDDGGGSGDGGQNVILLHALPDGAGDVLRKQHGGVHGTEELLHRRRTRPLGADAEALQLPLKGVGALQRGAPIVFAGVQRFQHLRKVHTLLPVHTLFQFQIVITHLISSQVNLWLPAFAGEPMMYLRQCHSRKAPRRPEAP